MGAVRIIVLAVALVAAIGLALMVRHMATPKPAPTVAAAAPPVEKPTTKVMVAKTNLAIGHRIVRDDIDWQPWPVESLNPAFITDGAAPPPPAAPAEPAVDAKDAAKTTDKTAAKKDGQTAAAVAEAEGLLMASISGAGARDQVVGAIVREPILAGEPIIERKLVRAGEGGYMAVVLQPGMRAVSLPVTVETGAGGFILPGDRVDVVQSRRVEKAANATGGGGGQDVESHTILKNIRVLAVDQATEPPKGDKAVVGAVATLEVAAADAPLVARAKTQGDVILALRSYADAGEPSGRAVQSGENQQVKVFRAGQASAVTVNE
jgi:pilus assembly protein CpaB